MNYLTEFKFNELFVLFNKGKPYDRNCMVRCGKSVVFLGYSDLINQYYRPS